jgi:hypothetical protein
MTRDPYAPPPRHRDHSGAMVRLVVVGALLAAAAWGFMEYNRQPQTAMTPTEQEYLAENEPNATLDRSEEAPNADAAAPPS